ncbi:glycosyltransferase family 2 protein [candidate division KSB1 bacterium]|nr:glycosyltransferase family 2 protein [candidate division KSB1 bacterium]MBL7092555.1 glycosyltransferase family 2 protein [candidate division KSB1 bacterium]
MKESKINISVVIPIYNEEENVALLYESITKVMSKLKNSYEIIMVDDGSKDKTLSILRAIQKKDFHLRVIKFRGNFGQSAAMAAGFEAARGENVVAMDGDLQNDPNDIPMLLKKLDEGYDVVSGWRKNRKDKLILRKLPSKIANRIICSVTGVELHDTGCSLKAFRKEVIKRISLYGELHRFIPALAKLEGAKITEVVVNHRARKFGESKYNITRTFRVIMDLTSLNLFIKHLRNPLRFFGGLALVSMFFAILATILAGTIWLNSSYDISSFNILLTLIFLMIVTTFQFLFIGLLAALIVHTGKKKLFYLVDTQLK